MSKFIDKSFLRPITTKECAGHGIEYAMGWQACINYLDSLPAVPLQLNTWIPAEKKPDVNGKYLVVGKQGAVNVIKYEDGRWYGKWGVIAWMQLPAPFKET